MLTDNYYFLISGSSSVWWNCFGSYFVYKRNPKYPHAEDFMQWLRVPFINDYIEKETICIIREKYPVQRIGAVEAAQ
jgi:hypothetical protein